jgi:hypothetical protein
VTVEEGVVACDALTEFFWGVILGGQGDKHGVLVRNCFTTGGHVGQLYNCQIRVFLVGVRHKGIGRNWLIGTILWVLSLNFAAAEIEVYCGERCWEFEFLNHIWVIFVLRSEVLCNFRVEYTRTRKSRVDVHPKTDCDECCLLDRTGSALKPNFVVMQNIPCPNLYRMKGVTEGLDFELTRESAAGCSGAEHFIEVGFRGGEFIYCSPLALAADECDVGFI